MAVDLLSLESALTGWEYAEYASVAFVILGVAGEYFAEFTDRLTGGDEHKKRDLRKVSTLVLITALAVELVCLVRTNTLSGRIIAQLGDNAARAILELSKFKTPRMITGEQPLGRVKEKLRPFAGTPFDISVYNDGESVDFMDAVKDILRESGWIRKTVVSPGGTMGVRRHLTTDPTDIIPFVFARGVRVDSGPGQRKAWTALISALQAEGIEANGTGSGADTIVPIEKQSPMHITIGRKP